MSKQTNYQQLIRNLEYLKLKQMVMHLDEVIDFGISNQLSFIETLIKLTNYEIDVREQNMIHAMVKVGAFPHLKRFVILTFLFSLLLISNRFKIF